MVLSGRAAMSQRTEATMAQPGSQDDQVYVAILILFFCGHGAGDPRAYRRGRGAANDHHRYHRWRCGLGGLVDLWGEPAAKNCEGQTAEA